MPRQLVDRWDEREWRRRDSRRRLLDRFRPAENAPTEAVTTPATQISTDSTYVQFLTTDPMWPGNAPQTTTLPQGFRYAGTTVTNFAQQWLGTGAWQTASTWVERVETPREEAERRRRQLIERNRVRAYRLRSRIAQRRARALLLSSLTLTQRVMYELEGRFVVLSQHGRAYEIQQGHSGNVLLREDGGRLTQFCAHGDIPMPDEDHMLAQKLMLETDEDGFLAIANATPLREPDSRGNIAA